MNHFLDAVFEMLLSNGAGQMIGATLWGAASVLLSPCGIAVVPLVVGYIAQSQFGERSVLSTDADDGADELSRWEAFKISCAFCSGIVVNLLLVAFVTSGFGLILGGHERLLTFVTATVFIIMGLHMTGLLHLRFKLPWRRSRRENELERRGLRGALALGIISGLAVGPCSIAYVSPVLSIAMNSASASYTMAVALVLCYALGYCAVLVFAGTFARAASSWLRGRDGGLRVLNVLCGVALIAVGVCLVREQMFLM